MQKLAASSDRLGAVADRLLAPVAVVAADSTLLYVNAAAARTIGQEPGWLIGRKMLDLIHREDRPRIRHELRQVAAARVSSGFTTYRLRADPAREWRFFESIADNLLDDPDVRGILISSRDVTEQLAHERELYQAAYHDPLTGLPNRAKVTEHLRELLAGEDAFAVAFVDIDRFRLINDSLGHSQGDAVFQAVAARVVSCLPSTTMVGRFGGDLLVLVVVGFGPAQTRALLWRVVERVGEALFVAAHELRLSVSVGVARRDEAATEESLLRDAGLALHRAKSNGGGRVELFEVGMRETAIARLELEANLRRALTADEFSLVLQPIVRLDDLSIVGAESLVRWHHGGETIQPCEFIPVAEETGLIVPLGDWIIDRAAQLAPRAPGAQIMVNLSARQLATPGLPERIARVLAARHLAPACLGFEITETLLVEDFDYTVGVLSRIHQLGCKVGLDDFGTGYSSLGYLRRLPIDFLKIDRSLAADVDTDRQAAAVVGAIIAMADALGIVSVAEGVETQGQASALAELGCALAQGHFFGRPTEPS